MVSGPVIVEKIKKLEIGKALSSVKDEINKIVDIDKLVDTSYRGFESKPLAEKKRRVRRPVVVQSVESTPFDSLLDSYNKLWQKYKEILADNRRLRKRLSEK